MSKVYDVIVLGAGPAGLAAGLYAGRSRLSTLVIEKGKDGGQIAITDDIENYPGQIVEGESGPSLIARMTQQCEKFGVERASDVINEVHLDGDIKVLKSAKAEYQSKTVIIATGAFARPIGCKGEKEFMGKGVSYCATCDANFFEDFEVYVVGGGDSAVEEAMYLTKFARKVTIIHRRDELRAAKSIQEKAFKNEKLHFMWDTVVEEVGGDGILSEMTVKNVKTGELTKIVADEDDGMFGVFGFIGTLPNSKIYEGTGLEMDERGYIPTDADMHTNIPGVFAAGDIRVKSLRQVVTAAADGAIAATQAEKYINEVDKKTFEDEVLKAEGYVFVDFFGDGCVPCQALMPFVHEMADKYGDKIKFTSLNTTKARRLAIGQKILGLPVMAIYKDGEKVEEVVKDDATQESIEAMIKKYI